MLLGVLAGVVLLWLALLAMLWRARPDQAGVRAALRLLPDVIRLLRRLAGDRQVPRGARAWLAFTLVYLACPIDLVPDVIPVLGYADDAVVVALALRSVVRHAGVSALERNWSGSPDGLAALLRLAGHTES